MSMKAYIDSLRELSRPQLELMLARRRREETEPIAVTGMGCRFPGGIDSPAALWRLVGEGSVLATKGAGPPLDSRGRPRWNLEAPDLAPIAAVLGDGAYLDGVDLFDPGYFGITESEAPHMDPQQRILLMTAAEALQDANLTRAALRGSRVGVFIGSSTVEYQVARFRNGAGPEGITAHSASGAALSGLASRTAVALGLNGPALTVDTACSSALVALHLAVGALRRRECDTAVVGAVHLQLSPWTTAAFAATGALSPSGSARPFAADADGYVRAEGCGVLVLRRAGEAGEGAYGLVRGTAVHQHGGRSDLTAPSGAGQLRVIEDALAASGVDPVRVDYIEAQANGLRLAEQVELEALAEVYKGPVRLGSSKANLGYLETASGALGLMKALLALHHDQIPPQPGGGPRSPGIAEHLIVPEEPMSWPGGTDRFAAVNAAGFTGTGAHAVLQGAAAPAPRGASPGAVPLELSAHSREALAATAARLLDHLERREDWDHADVCRTLALGRDRKPVRYNAVVTGRHDLLDRLAAAVAGRPGEPAAAGREWEEGGRMLRLPPDVFMCDPYWLEECRWR